MTAARSPHRPPKFEGYAIRLTVLFPIFLPLSVNHLPHHALAVLF